MNSEKEQITTIPITENVVSEKSQEPISAIPPQYQGLPSEIVEELWKETSYGDEAKDILEKERRERALAEIRQQEERNNTAEQLKTQRVVADQQKLDVVRQNLGIPPQPKPVQEIRVERAENKEATPRDHNSKALSEIRELLQRRISKMDDKVKALEGQVAAGDKNEKTINDLADSIKREEKFKNAYKNLLENLKKEGDERKIASLLMSELSLKMRSADYKADPMYNKAWEYANQNSGVASKKENDWMYRGVFASKDEGTKTETRGSLNVNVTPDVIRELDDLIKQGVIKANYKFGDPKAGSSGLDRHDAITIYFLEKPNTEALSAISDVAKRHLRGDDLIGNKVSEGFYMSDVGSVEDKHARELIDQVLKVNNKLGEAIRGFLTGKITGKEKVGEGARVAMSEAQFYSVKETLNTYGYDIRYDGQKGFTLIESK